MVPVFEKVMKVICAYGPRHKSDYERNQFYDEMA